MPAPVLKNCRWSLTQPFVFPDQTFVLVCSLLRRIRRSLFPRRLSINGFLGVTRLDGFDGCPKRNSKAISDRLHGRVAFTLMRPLMSITVFGGLGFILFHFVIAVRAHLRQSGEASVGALALGAGGFTLAWFLAGVMPMVFALSLMINKFD